MFGRRKTPEKLSGDSLFRRYSFRDGPVGPSTPLSDFADEAEIGLLNAIQEKTGKPIDLYVPSAQGSIGIDMSDPDAQQLVAGLEEELKRGIEERSGKLALKNALDENGDLKW